MVTEELGEGQRRLICKICPERARCLESDVQAYATREMPEGDLFEDDSEDADHIELTLYLETLAGLLCPERDDLIAPPDLK